MNSADSRFRINQSKVQSQQFEQFKRMLSLMEGYKNQLKYLSINAASERNENQTNLSAANLNVSQVSRLTKESEEINTARFREDIQNTNKWEADSIAALQRQFKGDTSSEEYQQQEAIIMNQAEKKRAEDVLNFQRKQVEAAKKEYDIKIRSRTQKETERWWMGQNRKRMDTKQRKERKQIKFI